LAALEVSVTLPPLQKVKLPFEVMNGIAGFGFTVTVVVPELATQPAAFVTVTA
jgi:hypothetical protein